MSIKPGAEPFHAAGTPGPDGRTVGVLLSHGFTGSPASITPWGRHLADLGFAVSVPRLPGHGTSVTEMLPTRYADYRAEVEREYLALADRCDDVVVGGLSMGGSLALDIAQQHRAIKGVVLVNPAVASSNKQLLVLPVLKHVLATMPGIGNDIKKPGMDELGYDRTPLKALASFRDEWKRLQADLGRITCPVLLFRSAEDHVVDPSSGRLILGGLSSRDVTERVLGNSFHVATLDHDAPQIFEESADFIRRVTSAA